MIARVWTTGVRPQRIDDCEKFTREIFLPVFRAQQGFLGCVMSHRHSVAQILTFLCDVDAITAFEQSSSYRVTLQKILATVLLAGRQSTAAGHVHLYGLGASIAK